MQNKLTYIMYGNHAINAFCLASSHSNNSIISSLCYLPISITWLTQHATLPFRSITDHRSILLAWPVSFIGIVPPINDISIVRSCSIGHPSLLSLNSTQLIEQSALLPRLTEMRFVSTIFSCIFSFSNTIMPIPHIPAVPSPNGRRTA